MTKKFTILHSNDMHGDFLAEVGGKKGELIGWLYLLSGYINKVRKKEENVLYFISGELLIQSLKEELFSSGKSKVISTSWKTSIEEYLKDHQNLSSKIESRLIYINI